MGLSCSITAELGKIQADARTAKKHFEDLQVLIFATPGKVAKRIEKKWKKAVADEFGWKLIVMSREDIITTLQLEHVADITSLRSEMLPRSAWGLSIFRILMLPLYAACRKAVV